MHLAGDLAEPPQPREEPRPVARASSSSASSQPSSPPRTYSWRIPSVAASGPPAYAYQPPSGGDVREAVLGEEAQHLELGVDAGLEPAEDLEDQLVVEDDRRVRLLGADVARVLQLAPETGEALDRAELDDSLRAVQRQAGAHRAHELAREARVLSSPSISIVSPRSE